MPTLSLGANATNRVANTAQAVVAVSMLGPMPVHTIVAALGGRQKAGRSRVRWFPDGSAIAWLNNGQPVEYIGGAEDRA